MFVTGLSIYASAFKAFRPEIAGMLVQPCLIPLALVAPLALYLWLNRIPTRILVGLIIFASMYSFSAVSSSISISDVVKIWSAVFMIVMPALLIKTRTDFIAAVLGFSLAIGLLGFHGLQSSETGGGENPMDVANRNSYSIYALPAVLLAGSIITKIKHCPVSLRVIFALSIFVTATMILLSGNRSGWLGVAVVGVLLIKDRKVAGLLSVMVIGAAIAYYITTYGDTTAAETKIARTQQGRTADNLRIRLIRACIEIGIQNPIIGVSPQGLPLELGRRIGEAGLDIVDSHNAFGHIIAGSGLICFAAMLFIGYSMWFFPIPNWAANRGNIVYARAAVSGMRSMLILWVARGMFGRDILYIPGPCIGLGLALGWCIVESISLRSTQGKVDRDTIQRR